MAKGTQQLPSFYLLSFLPQRAHVAAPYDMDFVRSRDAREQLGWTSLTNFEFLLLLTDGSAESERRDLLSELNLLKKLKPHPHIIRLLGCVTTDQGKIRFHCRLYNIKLHYACIVIGSYLWSTRGQTLRWRHHLKKFPLFLLNGRTFWKFRGHLTKLGEWRHRTVTHSAIALCSNVLFLPHFDIICNQLLNRRTATGNLFVKSISWAIYPAILVGYIRYIWNRALKDLESQFRT